jgi:beta-mannosidase
MTRKEEKIFVNDRSAAFYTIETVLEIWGTNSTLSDTQVVLEVSSFDLHSGWTDRWSTEVVLHSNSSTELYKGKLPGQGKRTNESQAPNVIVVSARLLDQSGEVLARYSNWHDTFFRNSG